MASIFTFDPDPPRVASPWSLPVREPDQELHKRRRTYGFSDPPQETVLGAEQSGLRTCLEAEPQSGPTEYKLHLLLRPRKSLSYTSTPRHAPGSRRFRTAPSTPRNDQDIPSGSPQPSALASGYRQHRLEQLTTQLLWRLQQSSPYHINASDNFILPTLPQAEPALVPPQKPAKLLPGLEDSKGALYEIGVADDGTFVGLTEDEMSESLNNLRAMAFSLGCSVEILRMVTVGKCEWVDDDDDSDLFSTERKIRKEDLYVAEAYVKPILRSEHDGPNQHPSAATVPQAGAERRPSTVAVSEGKSSIVTEEHKEQLRASLTGATTCGKSSILGTLSTSTLDNGRGKSRLSLLKHRHEIVSGMTSSVAQELLGYHDLTTRATDDVEIEVVNYATGNVSSWDDIHASSEPGRLAFLLDSAGHPRYRRTTVRGLMGWAPHWTFLCIAANDGSSTLVQDGTGTPEGDDLDIPGASAHISMAHLDLCLRLRLPLVVVITKMDVASRTSIRQVLSAVLTSLKAAGRVPTMLSNDTFPVHKDDLQRVSGSDSKEALRVCEIIDQQGAATIVPILFTSSVKGTGMGKLQALLRYLPIPSTPAISGNITGNGVTGSATEVLFHVNDSFMLNAPSASGGNANLDEASPGNIVSGRLEHGLVSIGDVLWLGPFSSEDVGASEEAEPATGKALSESFLSPRSFSDAVTRAMGSAKSRTTAPAHEWRSVRVISIRNLRLPVRQLHDDQVGTIGIVFCESPLDSTTTIIRKGMVLAKQKPQAAHSFTARFDISDSSSAVVGSMVIVYCGSVRASAKVIAVSLSDDETVGEVAGKDDSGTASDDGFGFEFDESLRLDGNEEIEAVRTESIMVTIQFLRHREFWGIGSRVLVMPSAGHGIAGLEGFVGTVVETFGRENCSR